MAVILWLAALAGALGVDVSAALRNALAPVSSRRIAVVQALPVVGSRWCRVAAVLVACCVLQASVASTVVPFVLVTVLAAVTFSLLAYALRLALGGPAWRSSCCSCSSRSRRSATSYRWRRRRRSLQSLNGVLPLTAYTNGASQLVSGGDVGSTFAVVLVLVVWGLAAFGATVVLVKRRRLVSSVPAPATPAGVGAVA